MTNPRDEIVKFLYELGECPEEVALALNVPGADKTPDDHRLNPLNCPLNHALIRKFPQYSFSVGYHTISYCPRDQEPFGLDVDRVVELPREVTDYLKNYDGYGKDV